MYCIALSLLSPFFLDTEGLLTWREEDPGRRRIILTSYVFCTRFTCKGLYFLHGAIARIFLVLGSSWLSVRKILVPCKLPSLRKIEDPASIAPLILHSLPYLEDSRSMPPVRCYICLETRMIDGIFAWKRGCLGNSDHGVQSYSRKK